MTKSSASFSKIFVCGAFSRSVIKHEFFALADKLEVAERIEYLGFLPTEGLYSRVCAAKAFMYPSHRDSFSMAILESLACGTPVVAYDIPAVRSVYGGLVAVKIVTEGNMQEMAEQIVRLLKTDHVGYTRMFEDVALRSLLEKHSSWENVARAEVQAIRSMLK